MSGDRQRSAGRPLPFPATPQAMYASRRWAHVRHMPSTLCDTTPRPEELRVRTTAVLHLGIEADSTGRDAIVAWEFVSQPRLVEVVERLPRTRAT